MAAVVRGEHGASARRAKAPQAARAAAGRGRVPSRPAKGSAKPKLSPSFGLGPRAATSIAALVIVGGALTGLVLSHRERAAAPASDSLVARWLAPLGFRLARVEVEGAPEMAKGDILRAANLEKDTPIVGIDLETVRQRVLAAGWADDVKVARLLPDTLIIAVTPRRAMAVWQHQGVSRVVDAQGRAIGGADPGRFPDLPLVVGEGAAEEAHVILPLLRQRPALMQRVDALIRVDARRWDLRLKDGSLIQLPAVGEDQALGALDKLEQQQRVLSLGFERIDLRDPETLVVRPKAAPPAAKN